jgi:hypothetical protein
LITQADNSAQVAFFTCVWDRDWKLVLDPVRFEANLHSCAYDFPIRLIVLNNFSTEHAAEQARRQAESLVERGLATIVVDHAEVLTDEVLGGFGLDPERFWAQNPYFTCAHLVALHLFEGKADYMFFLNGDVWLAERSDWVARAVRAVSERNDIRGLNLCRNIYRDLYPQWAQHETDELWLSDPPPPAYPRPRKGFSLSDHAYLLEVMPGGNRWQFDNSDALKPFFAEYPAYAQPCFECFIKAANARDSYGHAALKPRPGPITKHKKGLPRSRLKFWFYQALGYFSPGGRWAPPRVS